MKSVFILVIFLKVYGSESTLVDKLVSDYFQITDHLWSLLENRTENGLVEVEKRLRNIELDGEDDVALRLDIEDIKKEYGPQTYNILKETSYNYASKVESVMQFDEKIVLARNLTSMLDNITSLDEFWGAALEAAKNAATCNSYYNTAAQPLLLRYYYGIQLSFLRCFAMFQRLHMIAYIRFNTGNILHKSQAQELSVEFQKIFSNKRQAAKRYFKLASLEALRCKPTTFTEVTNFLQGYVDNEANLNPESSCSSQCSDYKQTKHFQCQAGSVCDTKEGRLRLRCNGIVRDCYELDSADVVLCLNNYDSTRRYNGIRVKNRNVAGRDIGSCQNTAKNWQRGFYRCTNCFCLCDDVSISERHFSLRDVVSNIDENKVISAVKINKVNGVIQFQIKERILLPCAVLDKRDNVLTIDGWLPASYFAVNDLNITKDVDFHELSYDKRAINLDEVKLPHGQVVTGLRFCIKNNRLTIEVRGTPFDYMTGKLKGQEESVWFSNVKGYNEISLVNLSPDRRGFYSYLQEEVSKVENGYLKFGPSGYSSDIGQTTIPFIDTASVEPRHLVPFSGMGLYYKSTSYSSGYIGPKLIVYDFEPHIL